MIFVEQTIGVTHSVKTWIERNLYQFWLILAGIKIAELHAGWPLPNFVLVSQEQFGMQTVAAGLFGRGHFGAQDLSFALATIALGLQNFLNWHAHVAHSVAPFSARVILIHQDIQRR